MFVILIFYTNTTKCITDIVTTHDPSDALNRPSTNAQNNFSVNSHPLIATDEFPTVEVDREEALVTFDGTNVIVNGESVGVSETVGGGAAYAVVESE